jgi:hypothetical protein
VIETWGPHVTYLSRRVPLTELLDTLVQMAEAQRSSAVLPLVTETHEYGDTAVLYVSEGAPFLEFLERTPLKDLMDYLANEGLTSGDDEEYDRQVDDISDIKAMAPTWRNYLDPADGSLRLYCD